MKIQTRILEILYTTSKETDIKTLINRSRFKKSQVEGAIRELRNRKLIYAIKEEPQNVGYKSPPFRRTKYIINKHRLNKIYSVIKERPYVKLG